jgi:hypothetical protein
MKKAHPMQPVEWDGRGVIRFQANPIVRYLLDEASARGVDLNFLARQSNGQQWTKGDWEHFAQLIGYSVSGWGSLGYVRDKTYAKAEAKVERLRERHPTDPAGAKETQSPLAHPTKDRDLRSPQAKEGT